MIASFTGPVEFSPLFRRPERVTHVVFDFDGTLSWLRHGWPELMCRVLLDQFMLKEGESEAALHEQLIADILSLNGRPSIHQIKLGIDLLSQHSRPGPPLEPGQVEAEYQRRLAEAIRERIEQINSGRTGPDQLLIFGARNLLEELHSRGLTLAILSGTAEVKVRQEAELLQIAKYFEDRIYGSVDATFTKKAVLGRLLASEKIRGDCLVSFGDGPVEIQITKAVGGLAVGVASDENVNGSGRIDLLKRGLLLSEGADIILPDYRDSAALLDSILPKTK